MAFVAPLPAAAPSGPLAPATSPRRTTTTTTVAHRPRAAPRRSAPTAVIAPPTPSSPAPAPAPGAADAAHALLQLQCFLPGTVHEVRTPAQFDALRAQAAHDGSLLVADFMASWCRKCLYLVPRLRKLAERHPRAYFCTVDVNKVARLPREFGIRKMPTFVALDARGERVLEYVAGKAAPAAAAELTSAVDRLVAKHLGESEGEGEGEGEGKGA